MTMAAGAEPQRSFFGARRRPGILGWIWRILAALLVLFVVSLVLGRFMPVASTLMLGRWVTGQEVSRQWVPLSEISPHLAKGVVAAEDQKFCGHWGVDFEALRDVLEDDEGPSRGASTVTMQLVKNVYLWPGRSYVRKAMELPLALIVDLAWGKKRVMEVYLNVAEWGEGIFGAEAAAQHHFRKSAKNLTPGEAARLVAILPNPIVRSTTRSTNASRRVARRMGGIAPLSACLDG